MRRLDVAGGRISLISSLVYRNEFGLPEPATIISTDVTWVDGASVLARFL